MILRTVTIKLGAKKLNNKIKIENMQVKNIEYITIEKPNAKILHIVREMEKRKQQRKLEAKKIVSEKFVRI